MLSPYEWYLFMNGISLWMVSLYEWYLLMNGFYLWMLSPYECYLLMNVISLWMLSTYECYLLMNGILCTYKWCMFIVSYTLFSFVLAGVMGNAFPDTLQYIVLPYGCSEMLIWFSKRLPHKTRVMNIQRCFICWGQNKYKWNIFLPYVWNYVQRVIVFI